MARTKQITQGRNKEPKDLKRRLSTKRSYLNQSRNVDNGAGTSGSPFHANLSSFTRTARKSIWDANASFETNQNISRKSLRDANRKPVARKSTFDATIVEHELLKMKTVRPSYGKTRLSQKRSSTKGDTTLNNSSTSRTDNLNESQRSQMSHIGRKSITDANTFPGRNLAKTFRKSGNRSRPFSASRITHRRKPGILALQEIRYYQKQTGLLIPKFSFQRVVKELLHSCTTVDYRIQREALLALQEATETHIVRRFENGQLCAIHANRVTLLPRDFALLKYFDD